LRFGNRDQSVTSCSNARLPAARPRRCVRLPVQPAGSASRSSTIKIERVDKRIDHPSGITLINEIITYYAPEADISGGRRR